MRNASVCGPKERRRHPLPLPRTCLHSTVASCSMPSTACPRLNRNNTSEGFWMPGAWTESWGYAQQHYMESESGSPKGRLGRRTTLVIRYAASHTLSRCVYELTNVQQPQSGELVLRLHQLIQGRLQLSGMSEQPSSIQSRNHKISLT